MSQLSTPAADLSATSSLSKAPPSDAVWHATFLPMVPKIKEHASYRFRGWPEDVREEAIQETLANACQAYARLAQRGATDSATWSSLAKYAIRQVRTGRKVGGSLNVRDVSSRYCQRHYGVSVHNLHRWDDENQEWTEMVVEDRRTTPADIAALRIDFWEFLKSLSRRHRKIALKLAKGYSTSAVAKMFELSAARISQIRRELDDAWQAFHGEPACV